MIEIDGFARTRAFDHAPQRRNRHFLLVSEDAQRVVELKQACEIARIKKTRFRTIRNEAIRLERVGKRIRDFGPRGETMAREGMMGARGVLAILVVERRLFGRHDAHAKRAFEEDLVIEDVSKRVIAAISKGGVAEEMGVEKVVERMFDERSRMKDENVAFAVHHPTMGGIPVHHLADARRQLNEPATCHAGKFPCGRDGIGDVLEDLRAPDEIESAVGERKRFRRCLDVLDAGPKYAGSAVPLMRRTEGQITNDVGAGKRIRRPSHFEDTIARTDPEEFDDPRGVVDRRIRAERVARTAVHPPAFHETSARKTPFSMPVHVTLKRAHARR